MCAFISLGKYLVVQCHRVGARFAFLETTKLFSKVVVPFYNPEHCMRVPVALLSHYHIILSTFSFFSSEKVLLHTELGWGSVLLGCCLPHGCKDIAQLLSLPLGMDVSPTLHLMNFRDHLSLETWAAPWHAAHRGQGHVPLRSYLTWTWCAWWGARHGGCPQLAHVLGHSVALDEAHGQRIMQRHGHVGSN